MNSGVLQDGIKSVLDDIDLASVAGKVSLNRPEVFPWDRSSKYLICLVCWVISKWSLGKKWCDFNRTKATWFGEYGPGRYFGRILVCPKVSTQTYCTQLRNWLDWFGTSPTDY